MPVDANDGFRVAPINIDAAPAAIKLRRFTYTPADYGDLPSSLDKTKWNTFIPAPLVGICSPRRLAKKELGPAHQCHGADVIGSWSLEQNFRHHPFVLMPQ
jgi:hypothetical protein